MSDLAARAAERAARASYGRLVALLAGRCGDVAAAEDALADAFRSALETWPESGVPDNPDAWLFTAARHRHLDLVRSAAQRARVDLEPQALENIMAADAIDADAIPDERLKLMFVCAHPAIAPEMHAPLMLQTVLGLDAEAIGRAFLVADATMAQRLVRAKRKIREARIRFALPARSDMPARIDAVLEAIYGAFAIGWDSAGDGGVADDGDLAEEARYLSELLATLVPESAEALGLAALVDLASSRRAARLDAAGHFVPLSEQDVRRWDAALIERGERWLRGAHERGVPQGRFQLEAAIQSVHADRLRSGTTDWRALALLYEGLMRCAPSIGAAVGRALAVGHAVSARDGLAALERIDPAVREGFQPYWATKAELATMAHAPAEARLAYAKAIALARSASARGYLRAQAERLPR